MPRPSGKRKQQGRNKGGFGQYEFIESRLKESQKAALHKWATEHAEDAIDLLASVVNSGYKLSLNWSDYNDCYTSSLTGTGEDGPNFELVMVSRSDDLWEAIMMTLFKHIELYQGDAWPTDKQAQDWG